MISVTLDRQASVAKNDWLFAGRAGDNLRIIINHKLDISQDYNAYYNHV